MEKFRFTSLCTILLLAFGLTANAQFNYIPLPETEIKPYTPPPMPNYSNPYPNTYSQPRSAPQDRQFVLGSYNTIGGSRRIVGGISNGEIYVGLFVSYIEDLDHSGENSFIVINGLNNIVQFLLGLGKARDQFKEASSVALATNAHNTGKILNATFPCVSASWTFNGNSYVTETDNARIRSSFYAGMNFHALLVRSSALAYGHPGVSNDLIMIFTDMDEVQNVLQSIYNFIEPLLENN